MGKRREGQLAVGGDSVEQLIQHSGFSLSEWDRRAGSRSIQPKVGRDNARAFESNTHKPQSQRFIRR